MSTTYKHASGVDYANMDAGKRENVRVAVGTLAHAKNLEEMGWDVLQWTYGESVQLARHLESDIVMAFVTEGLGTKYKVAQDPQLREYYRTTFYDWMGWDNAFTAILDLTASGAVPLFYQQHIAMAEGDHLKDSNGHDLRQGTANACKACGFAWLGGETCELDCTIQPGQIELSGSCQGQVPPGMLIHPDELRHGLRIILLGSSGPHMNGYTKLRALAETLPQRYLTPVGDRTFGHRILQRCANYFPYIRQCQKSGIKLYACINISGHGFAKILRANVDLTYQIDALFEENVLWKFIRDNTQLDDRELYQAFNMGAGLALLMESKDVKKAEMIARMLAIPFLDAGCTKKGSRRVIIKPLCDVEYTPADLNIR